MNAKTLDQITTALCKKYWFGGKTHFPWHHPINKVANALMIHLDGCCCYKFKVHKNGKLRAMKIYSTRFLSLGLRPLQTITVSELLDRIERNTHKYSSSFIRARSPVPIH